jgi:cell cycle arrest protein BUB2
MNVLAAPFLMVMNEMEAFHAYSTFIWKWCPLYVQPTMKGVHCGLRVSRFFFFCIFPTLINFFDIQKSF